MRPRKIELQVQDVEGNASLLAVVDIMFSGVNDPPVLNLNAFETANANFYTTFIEGGNAISVSEASFELLISIIFTSPSCQEVTEDYQMFPTIIPLCFFFFWWLAADSPNLSAAYLSFAGDCSWTCATRC